MNTPLTDACEVEIAASSPWMAVPSEFARKLETERDELRRMLLKLWKTENDYGDPDNAAVNEVWMEAAALLERIKP